ncbi:uncharacterized protein [Centruroides vittatus]|uniref:uncharacterized protein LOC111620072 n=1 Tax=Centruroides sculpturatus TaxID=218467 RepID=UPI000C6D08B6|nr:uncharacterized protein LOC111620072 [Centruroides sculpturatus]XP_023217690.1 uncharacterized protein LOC111620076 [Centruroides sculpturatus]
MLLWSIFLSFITLVWSHGRLLEPPSRSSMWRFGFKNPVNYDDDSLYCGGISVHWNKNGGKCGICGDPWNQPEPRDNEDGGIYGNKIIARTYKSGQEIDTNVYLTATHQGYFEFRICPLKTPDQKADQECLDQYLLERADGKGTKFPIPPGAKPDNYPVKLKLPQGLTCDRCVFQWHYRTGNSWGICENGKGALGCGPQEYFRGCADIAIK